ncbi:BspA family leucine-rich repeat surface protein [Nonlabens ulvanivorans]|uniref:BspA family leucine-rich repeat surface protein n=1 Tax=Nonlabens ulvanivorans TaxID=906888 RepID=UPI002942D496|nr:BspA family leucine-rich repeat surface protein [Nonlabens ulvanivorans]WOI22004.1 BspA family leucine-rich repeat surface protein [Nonlabens ulvanivorans]
MRIFTIVFLFFGLFASAQTADDFVFTIDYNNPWPNNFNFRLYPNGNNTLNINWGDGQTETTSGSYVSHTYTSNGNYTIIVSGNIDYFRISGNTAVEINQWGTNQWTTMLQAFQGCNNLTINASDTPDLSQVTVMNDIFAGSDNFNSDISNWDVSNVIQMERAFNNTEIYNQPLNSWDVSNVINMDSMFAGALAFNQPLDNWDVSNVLSMNQMFSNTVLFNQSLNNWNVSSVSEMNKMFSNSEAFNQSLDQWDITSVTDIRQMFTGTLSFNQPLNSWDVSNITRMNRMFDNAQAFNQSLNSWNVSNVTDMEYMFYRASLFNGSINNWNVSSVTDMQHMFEDATMFNQPLDQWNTASLTTMYNMFENAISFNQPIDTWNISNVTSLKSTFEGAISFNQSLNNWDTSSVLYMDSTFEDAIAFNGGISNWNTSNVNWTTNMFAGATVFNQPIGNWDVSSVSNMKQTFQGADSFNQNLNNWDVSNVTNMRSMFQNALAFNQPLNSWDISNVTDMYYLLRDALGFNQNLYNWNFNNSVNLTQFIRYSGLDSQNYDLILRRLVDLNLSSRTMSVFGLEYCDFLSRDTLIQNGWTFYGDTQSSTCATNVLNGNVLFDLDNNGCTVNDVTTDQVGLLLDDGLNQIIIYNSQSLYNVNLPSGTYTITPVLDLNLFTSSPQSASVTLANTSTITQDFCLTATSPIDDLEVTILPLEQARPGFDTDYKLIYKNKGNTVLSGSLDFNYEDDYMNFLTANPVVTTSSVGSLNWSFSNLDPFETREIEFSMNLNSPTVSNFPLGGGEIINFNATINPTANDDTPLDNVFDLQQVVVNSYDPNDKTCLQSPTILPSEVGEYVHYRIRFENEGTASAINVRIVDYIDTTTHDISTLTPLSASHDYTTTITEGNKVEFLFENINLPFTAPASQGYVLFKIKTIDTLVLGDDFSNQAEIYFDFNAPIITNLETTAVAVPASVTDSDLFQLQLVPNPANSLVAISSNISFQHITIYNTSGQVVFNSSFSSFTLSHTLELENLSSGLYFVEISNADHKAIKKLLKQ